MTSNTLCQVCNGQKATQRVRLTPTGSLVNVCRDCAA